MRIELHDTEVDNTKQGTLAATIGKDGSIEYPYQAEMWVQEALGDDNSIRAVLLSDGTVLAVWRKDESKTVFEFKSPHYRGEWVLPIDHEDCPVFDFTGETNADGVDVVESWVTDQFVDDGRKYAIVVREGGVLGIWGGNDADHIEMLVRHPGIDFTLGVPQLH